MNFFLFYQSQAQNIQKKKKKSFLTQPSTWIGSRKKKKKNCSVSFSVISWSFLVRLETCWFLLIPSRNEMCWYFALQCDFFQRLKFPFKYKILYLQIKILSLKFRHFLQGLTETYSACSWDQKCLLRMLVSVAILYLQHTQQNLASYFLERSPAIHLSVQTPC